MCERGFEKETKAKKAEDSETPGWREKVKFLVMLSAEAIKSLKLEAIEHGVTASSVLKQAVSAWMKRSKDSPRRDFGEEKNTDKRQFLSQMDANLIRQIKILAIDQRVTASMLVGIAVSD